MNDRVNPFADLNKDLPAFTTKPKAGKPIEEESVTRIAEENKFPSRQAPKPAKANRPKRRVYRTGRNVQFNAKVTPETNARIYKAADEKGVVIGEVLRLAMNALEREGGPPSSTSNAD